MKKYNLHLVFILLIIFLLLFNWIKPGFQLATSDEGLPLYNSSHTYEMYSNFWIETGFGRDNPFYISRLSLYGLSSILQSWNFSPSYVQAIIFFVILVTPLFFLQKLVRLLFPEVGDGVSYLTSLFYLFNLFTLTQVFSRFLYPLMFAWSYLPLFLFLWINWIDYRKTRFVVYILITSFLFSDAFGLVSAVFVVWVPALLYSLISIIKNREKLSVCKATLIGFAAWIVFNLWWLYPMYKLQNSSFGPLLENNLAYESLHEVSQYFPNTSIFQLKQEYWLGVLGPWPDIYHTSASYTNISLIIFLIFILGVFTSVKLKNWRYIFILSVLSWFIVKGTNPPFGSEVYQFIYKYIPFTQVLRNPYEKFGSVWLLTYSVFFALGVRHLYDLLHKMSHIRNLVTVFLLLYSFVYLPRPIWDGTLFRRTDYIKVPKYYETANNYLNQHGDGRILHLPFLKDSLVRYNWNYIGEEPSEFLFDRSSVAKSAHVPKFDRFYHMIHLSMQSKNFHHLLDLVDIEHIVLHKDVIVGSYYDENIEQTREVIQTWEDVSFESTFGDLDIYKNNNSNGSIYVLNTLEKFTNIEEGLTHILQDDFDTKNTGIIIENEINMNIEPFSSRLKPKVEYTKKSADGYVVVVKDATDPFVLVLANNFNSNWVARIDDYQIHRHLEVNGFANGWIVDKKGDYIIDIQFKVWPWD